MWFVVHVPPRAHSRSAAWLRLRPKADSERKRKKKIRLDHISNISESFGSRVSHTAGMHGWSSATPTAAFRGNVDTWIAIRLDFISRGVRDREELFATLRERIYCARRLIHHDSTRRWTVAFAAIVSRDCEGACAFAKYRGNDRHLLARAEILLVVLQSILRNEHIPSNKLVFDIGTV